jgi:glycosyltransferase involved in cell wall biosynthesis
MKPVVLFLHPSNEMYGADRSLLALVRSIRDIARPLVILPNDLPYQGVLEATLRAEGVDVRVGGLPVLRRRYLHPLRMPGWLARSVVGIGWLLFLARREGAVGVVTNTTGIVIGPVVSALLKKPHLWYVREIVERPRWFRQQVRFLSRLSTGIVVAVSGSVAAWIGEVHGRGPIVGYNGVDLIGSRTALPSTPTATFVGRLNSWKGWEGFISAAAIIHERIPLARFVMVGGTVPGEVGSEARFREALREWREHGDWLTWIGEVAEARTAMREAWVVVVPSIKPDPFPNVVLEAMAEGRAVVGTRLGGIPEMVDDYITGRLVEPGDPRALAEAVGSILVDRNLAEAMGKAGLARAERDFSRDVSVARWRSTFSRYVLRQNSGAPVASHQEPQ